MTAPFRTLAGSAARRRVRPAIERSTFVVVGLGAERLGLPVELVERVVRLAPRQEGVEYDGQQLAWVDLAASLGISPAAADVSAPRAQVLRDRHRCWAVAVDSVFEVCAVETTRIQPWSSDTPSARREARVATFERLGQTIVVIDALRLLPDFAS